jgi:hypothetical protein
MDNAANRLSVFRPRRAMSTGVFPGAAEETYYVGVSLGGIMGLFTAALTPDIERFHRRRRDQLLAAAPAFDAVLRVRDGARDGRPPPSRSTPRSASACCTSNG